MENVIYFELSPFDKKRLAMNSSQSPFGYGENVTAKDLNAGET